MNTRLSPFAQALAKMLRRHEGIKPDEEGFCYAYEDTSGITIAGHFIRDKALVAALKECGGGHMSLTVEAVDLVLAFDMGEAIQTAARIFSNWRKLDDNRRLALANLAYNLGCGRLMKFEKMIRAVSLERWKEAADELRYVNGQKRDKPSAYSVEVGRRCEEIAIILETGEYKEV